MTEQDIFVGAVELTDPAARAAYLDRACGGDPALRRRVAGLIGALDRAGDFLQAPAAAAGDPEATRGFEAAGGPGQSAGDAVGPYALLELLGEGGMGAVWAAEQRHPVRRKVALKLIKPGMDSRQVLARFEQERQALALMDHPHIARVLDAGATADGRPYFAMELVRGLPVTDYCDRAKLPVRDRLALFADICRAVQHAHQKGVIHRDLKPSNVLVTVIDGRPVPKVIDFGIAKATGGSLTDRTLHTGHFQMVGTPLYMSPEQAELSGVDVDTRADVYSLGVVLYELLTGTTPFDREAFRKAGLDEVRRMIREDEPARPSKRVSTLAAGPASTAADRRGVDARRLGRLVRGELDWLAMRCLEKDRARRYQSPAEVAADVERYLAGEAVEAVPPSAGYRLRKFVRRHKGQVTAASVVLLALLGGLAGTTWGLFAAKEQERQAIAARDAEAAARVTEEQERKYAQAIADFVVNDFLALTSVEGQARFSNPASDKLGKDATLPQLLGRAAAKLDGRTDLAPRTEAELRWIIGVNFRDIGEAAKAIPHLERCLALRREFAGETAAETLEVMNSLSVAYGAAGQLDRALALCEETLRLQIATLGADHLSTLSTMSNLGAGYQEAGKLNQALPLCEEALRRLKATVGPDDPQTLTTMRYLAQAYQQVGKLDLAMPLLEEALRLRTAALGADHPHTVIAREAMASGLRAGGKLDQALPLYEDVLRFRRGGLEADHPQTLLSMNNLAAGYRDVGKLEQALALFQEAVAGVERRKYDHPHVRSIIGNLIDCHERLQQFDQAEAWRRKWLAVVKDRSGVGSQPYAAELAALGRVLLQQEKWADAELVLRESLALREETQPDAWTTFNTQSLLGGALLGQKKYAGAEPLLVRGYEGMQQRADAIPPPGRPRLPEAAERLARLYEATGRPDRAKAVRGEPPPAP